MTQAETVRRVIKAELAYRGLSQAALAPVLSITQQSVSSRFTGEVDFRLGELEQIADFFGIPLEQLLRARDEAVPA